MGAINAAADEIQNAVRFPPPNVNANDTSDVHLEKLKLFQDIVNPQRMGSLYDRWNQCVLARKTWDQPPWGQHEAESQLLPQLFGFNWGLIYDVAQRMGALATVGASLGSGASASQSALDGVWKGAGADAALQKFADLKAGAAKYQQTNASISGQLMGMWQTTREPVLQLAAMGDSGRVKDFCGFYESIDDTSRSQKHANIGYAEQFVKDFDIRSREQGLKVLTVMGASLGANTYFDQYSAFGLAKAISSIDGLPGWAQQFTSFLGQFSPSEIAASVASWITGKEISHIDDIAKEIPFLDDYCQQYNDTVVELRQRITETHRTVRLALETADDQFRQFGWGTEDSATTLTPFAKLAPPKAEEPPPAEKPASEPKPGGGVASGPGMPATPGGGGVSPPAPPAPPTPPMPEPGKNPVTGEALEIDPETGKALPIDPVTGEVVADAAGEPETMTVEKGDNRISLTEPDADGKMTIGVEGKSGEPQTFELNFDPKEPGAETDPESNGHVPGPDGKIHIDEGGLKITAERPDGPGGPTLVTVDDGSGEPTTYTLGEKPKEPGPAVPTGMEEPAVAGRRQEPVGPDADVRPVSTAGVADGPAQVAGAEAVGSPEPAVADATTPQAVGAGDATAPQFAVGDAFTSEPAGGLGSAETEPGGMPPRSPAGAGLGSAPGGGASDEPGAGAGTAGMGMPMMGGVGGGAGGGNADDSERGPSQFRQQVTDLFEPPDSGSRISGSLDDLGSSVRFDR
ncbi:WXG100 family type VII secretion target [Amycolatopsis suaedae]|uniref:WXG100 family type VII secretion target n=1 Tax=Amycolatopsis suaedae TaxID=2510978 RepID=A0A4Q7J8P0_9PSEU|nr:WXG100 family type VII secretion target [Amycolatopsis suaedae]RZQ64080.1 hypothetical protein EWH70_08770 [Amycolatopsis suaedae]